MKDPFKKANSNACPECVGGYKWSYKFIMVGKAMQKVPTMKSPCTTCRATGKMLLKQHDAHVKSYRMQR